MSLRKVVECIKYNLMEYFMSLQKEENESFDLNKLKDIQFNDISESFPKEYFILDKEPVYAFYRLICGHNIVLMSDNPEKKKSFTELLTSLFIEKAVGKQKVFLSDFSGITDSKNADICSFSKFKTEQYNENKDKEFYTDYTSLRNDVFNADRTGNTNSLKNAIILNWSNSIFASNRDRSHRFAALCKWNELENRNDSEFFNVNELSIDKKRLIELLNCYYGFIIHSKTASEIIKVLKNNQFYHWQYYCPFFSAGHGEIIVFFVDKNDMSREFLEVFLKTENCIFINEVDIKKICKIPDP